VERPVTERERRRAEAAEREQRRAEAIERERAAAVREALRQVQGSLGRSAAPRYR
jgi:hypothetical protein